MKTSILLIALFFLSLINCTNMKNNKPTTIDCFNADNFQKVIELIDFRISVSGMGKFYVTYPKEVGKINDGKKRLPKNPDDVFDVYQSEGIIHLKSPKHYFKFLPDNGLFEREEVNAQLADELFCYLLKL